MELLVERSIDDERKQELGLENWPVWSREVSKFDWSYSSTETGFLIKGELILHLSGKKTVELSAGDLVQFPAGLDCSWEILADLEKFYSFDPVDMRPDESIKL